MDGEGERVIAMCSHIYPSTSLVLSGVVVNESLQLDATWQHCSIASPEQCTLVAHEQE